MRLAPNDGATATPPASVLTSTVRLLPANRHVEWGAKGCQIQRRRIDAVELDEAIAVDKLQVLKEAIGIVPRSIGDLAIKPLTADIVANEIGGLLIGCAVLQTQVPVAFVVVEIHGP